MISAISGMTLCWLVTNDKLIAGAEYARVS